MRDDSDLGMVFPDEKKIDCRDCIYRKKNDPTNGRCEVYVDPYIKPNAVLWEYKKCKYKVAEGEEE